MNHTPEAIRIADGLDQNVQIDPQTSEDEPGGYRSELDELMAEASAILRSQHTRIAELEAMLDAIGAGGVGQSIKPQVQDDTAQKPVAWRVHPFDYGVGSDGVYALTMRTEQVEVWQRKEWKVEPLYAAPQPALQPLTAEAFTTLAHRLASKYAHRSDPAFCGYAFLPHTLEQFVRAIEEAHGIR